MLLKETITPPVRGGVYMLVTESGDVRVLVDADLPVRVPCLKDAVETFGQALIGAASEGMTVSITFDRWP